MAGMVRSRCVVPGAMQHRLASGLVTLTLIALESCVCQVPPLLHLLPSLAVSKDLTGGIFYMAYFMEKQGGQEGDTELSIY